VLQPDEHMSETATTRFKDRLLPELDDLEFAAWANLLERRVGLLITPDRRSFLASGIRSRMRTTGCRNYSEYYRKLEAESLQTQEWSLLVDSLTVHETCFFRHRPSMSLVENVLLPEVFSDKDHFYVWSVGCASGEEAWSLAMIADHFCSSQQRQLFFGVTGTDISLPALKLARDGVYLNRRLTDIAEQFQQRYCRSASAQHFSIHKGLRKRVCFSQLNLRDIDEAPFSGLDLIYCQNLLIYFDRERRKAIVDSLSEYLRPGGVLILGPGELMNWEHPEMERVRYEDTLAYRRRSR
jgi:chemotaxis protein methyltransferase CheR/type IV pilus assembly protein PilK